QAEDGIRDFHVTGVQTCALPIYRFTAYDTKDIPRITSNVLGRSISHTPAPARIPIASARMTSITSPPPSSARPALQPCGDCAARSEERRVGKECRGRGCAQHDRK